MCDDETKAILRALLDATSSDIYEPGGIFTLGGPTGTYQVKTPWNTEAEWSLVFASVTGNAGDAIITVSSSNPTNPSSAANVYGLSSGGGETNNAFEGWSLHVSSTGASPIEVWSPLGRGGNVFVGITATTGNAFVQIAFRRKMVKYIPDKPRALPHTHSHVASRRDMRAILNASKMVQGFEAQYPIAGGYPYLHEPIPEDQDVENIGHTGRRTYRGYRT